MLSMQDIVCYACIVKMDFMAKRITNQELKIGLLTTLTKKHFGGSIDV
jgi:hypothetical protein